MNNIDGITLIKAASAIGAGLAMIAGIGPVSAKVTPQVRQSRQSPRRQPESQGLVTKPC